MVGKKMEKIKNKIDNYKSDIQNPEKNLALVKEIFLEIEKYCNEKVKDESITNLINETKLSLEKIEELAKPRTYQGDLVVWALSEKSSFINSQLNSKEQDTSYLKAIISQYLLDVRVSPEAMKSSLKLSILLGIGGIVLSFLPIWSYLSIIIGAYLFFSRDYRDRILSTAIFVSVVIGFLVNYFIIR